MANEGMALRERIAMLVSQQPAAHSGFHLVASGHAAFIARIELIRNARESLDLQYYIAHDGISTRLMMRELLSAAQRGVKIRVLMDDLSSDPRDHRILITDRHPNLHIRVFNPPPLGRAVATTRMLGRLLAPSRQHRRMHNKLLAADGQVAVIGGRNLGDEYFDEDPDTNLVDIELLSAGPVVTTLIESFDEYWEHKLSEPLQDNVLESRTPDGGHEPILDEEIRQARKDSPDRYSRLTSYEHSPQLHGWLERLTWARAEGFWDPPGKVEAPGTPPPRMRMTTPLIPAALNVQHEFVMASAYFVPMDTGVDYLRDAINRGISVTVLTNALEANDVPQMHGGYFPYRKALLQAGVKLHEVRARPRYDSRYNLARTASSLHSKAAVFDRRRVFVGPLNFDPRSVLWNTENGVLIESPELAETIRELIMEGTQPSISYRLELDGDDGIAWKYEDEGEMKQRHQEPGNLWRRLNARLAHSLRLHRWL